MNSNYNISTYWKTYCGAYISSVGSTSSSIRFSVQGGAINDLLRQANITQNLAQIVVIDISSYRDGTPIGTYNLGGGGGQNLTDISGAVETIYFLDSSSITVTSIDQNYVTGNVSLKLIDGNNIIPAIGSFRLHNL